MAYSEYNDMFVKCQKDAPYKLYIYDLVDSRKIYGDITSSNLQLLIFTLYIKIKRLENDTNNQILHLDDLLNYTNLRTLKKDNKLYYNLEPERAAGTSFQNSLAMLEPFLLSGDCIGFSVNRGTISDELVDKLFEETKKELNIDYQFHKANGYYETDNWLEGKDKYYRGYAINLLSELHKEKNKVLRKIKYNKPDSK